MVASCLTAFPGASVHACVLRISDIGLFCRLGLMVGEAFADFGSLIAMGMIAFPSPQSPRGQVVGFNYQKWVCVGGIGFLVV